MEYSALFTQHPGIAMLNAGTQSRAPLEVLAWMREQREIAERNPTEAYVKAYPALWEVQKRLAAFLGASPHDLFLRANITAAFNDFMFALPLPAGAEILTSNLEYGAISNLARWRAKQDRLGFRSMDFPFGAEHTAREMVEAVVKALRPETKVFLLSHVATGTGVRLPIESIAAELRSRGVITAVDGAHAVGGLPVDLGALEDVDFYGGNFHKWFMGPAGTAFGWVNPRWKGKLSWRFGGWASFEFPPSYGTFGEGEVETARRFMPGTIDFIPFLALGPMVDFWEKLGVEVIRKELALRRDLVAKRAEGMGWKRACPRDIGQLSPLVSYERPAAWGSGTAYGLATRIYRESRVQLALTYVSGRALVRLSPGLFTSPEEIERGMAALGAFSG